MPALTTAAVTNRTTSGCTLTFNAASVDCNVAQLLQLQQLLARLLVDTNDEQLTNAPATITVSALG